MATDKHSPGRDPNTRMKGTFIVDTPPSITFTDVNAVLFNSDGNNTTGGFLQGEVQPWKPGRKDDAAIILGFSAAKAGAGNPQTFNYPDDFHEPYVRWSYTDQEGKRHAADRGTITVEFGNNFRFFKGVYSFVDMEGQTITGSFDIGYLM